jgi:DNA polymerase III alpha subunit
MNIDKFGRSVFTESEITDLLYENPELNFTGLHVTDPLKYNSSVSKYYGDLPLLDEYQPLDVSVEEFDAMCQEQWYMPDDYKNMDIAAWVLERCSTQDQLQRAGKELLMFQERDLINLLKFLKYFVDTMKENGILWGLGRGSSVSSYVLYLIGVHKIDSMYYDLEVEEFLR